MSGLRKYEILGAATITKVDPNRAICQCTECGLNFYQGDRPMLARNRDNNQMCVICEGCEAEPGRG